MLENCVENLPDMGDLLTSPANAVIEMSNRRGDSKLNARVEEYLRNDIPEHFKTNEVFFYLSRHLATPNFETLKANEIANEHRVPLFVGEDHTDKFVAHNQLKKALGKMSFETALDKKGNKIIVNKTIIDFNTYNGKTIDSIDTISGQSLTAVHHALLKTYEIQPYDESKWVQKHKKLEMCEYYERFLALMIVHGIMLEFYAVEDVEFIDNVMRPAFQSITKRFGCKPLICTILSPEEEFSRDWLAYPNDVLIELNKIMTS